MPTIDIILRAVGASQTQQALKATADETKSIGTAAQSTEAGLSEADKALGRFVDKAGKLREANGQFVKVKEEVAKTNTELDKLSNNSAFDRLAARANSYWTAVDQAKEKTEGLNRSFEGMRNTGAVIAGIGAATIVASQQFIQAANEDMATTAKLEAMLRKRGEGGRFEEMAQWAKELAYNAALVDDDPIKNAAAGLLGFGINANQIREIMPGLIGQSRLYGQSLDSVAMALGKAFAKGDVGALTKSGVTIDPADIEKLKSINDFAERQAFLFKLVKQSMDNYSLSMTEGMSEGEIAANRATLAFDDFNTNVGAGMEAAQNKVKGLGASLVGLSGSADGQKTFGSLIYYAGLAASVIGGGIGLAGQIGMTVLGFKALFDAKTADTVASGINAGANDTEAASIAGVGAAAEAAAVKVGLLGKARALLLNPVTIAGAVAIYGANVFKGKADASFAAEDEYNQNSIKGSADERVAAIDKEIGRLQNEKKGSWPVNLHTGLTPAQYDQKIRDLQEERAGVIAMAEKSKKMPAASTLQDKAAAAGDSAPSALAKAADKMTGDTDAIEEQIQDLQDQIRHTKDKDIKAALREQLIILQRQFKAMKDGNRDAEKAARKAQKEADKRTKGLIEDDREQLGVKAVDIDEQFATRIFALELERDKARKVKDEAREKQLNDEIGKLNIEKQFAQDKIRAESEALENEKKADSILTQAKRRRQGALERLAMQASAVASTYVSSKFGTARAPSLMESSIFNPFSGKSYEGTTGTFNFAGLSYGYDTGGMSQSIPKARGNVSQDGRGNFLIQFEPLTVPNTMRHSASLLPGG